MNIIFYIHTVVFIAGLVIPFVGSTKVLEVYSLFIPFLFYHWLMNDDTCALTEMESWATGEKKEHTFMGRVFGPIYKMNDDDAGKVTKTLFVLLWFFVQFRLGRFHDLKK